VRPCAAASRASLASRSGLKCTSIPAILRRGRIPAKGWCLATSPPWFSRFHKRSLQGNHNEHARIARACRIFSFRHRPRPSAFDVQCLRMKRRQFVKLPLAVPVLALEARSDSNRPSRK
jgi:hypothetical protein